MEKVKTKLLVLGSTGMLGHTLFHYLENNSDFELHDVVYRNKLRDESVVCDVTNAEKLEAVICTINPDVIVNCIGVLIKGSQHNPANAIYINAFLPHKLANIADKLQAKLIHVSTDCVFSGKKGAYLEKDYRDADDTYGRSKALGEMDCENHVTVRTSIIGPEIKTKGEGLLHWFLNAEGDINGFTTAYWGGVTTLELSKAILEMINQDIRGLINITNGEAISKFELVSLFKTAFNRKQISISAFEGKQVNKSLKSSREDFNFQVSSYKTMVQEMATEIYKNKNRYTPYYSL